ncbi:MAG: pentapeptide repeat-containing protein [Burkholderiales bacterium]|nr:pentapeptide repeat-containing protein [Burkholderiales bacterium]MDE2626721.1 pentapeptide repeat-containing protein [Burkholderiales bacterium]
MTAVTMIADLRGADHSGADLSGTIFRGVQGYAQAKGLDHAENVDKIVR